MGKLILLVLLFTSQFACGDNKHSGIVGESLIACPSIAGSDCWPTRFPTTIGVYSEKGDLIETLVTDNEGLFLIYLKPGVYTLVMKAPRGIPPFPPLPPYRPPPPPLPDMAFTVELSTRGLLLSHCFIGFRTNEH